MVTFANLGSVRLPSLKFVGLRVRKIRRILCVSCLSTTVSQLFEPQLQKIVIFTYPGLHFFVCPGDVPSTITQNVAWMKRQFSACQTPCSIYLQQFSSYSNRKCKKSPFSRTAAHIFVSPGDAPGAITLNVVWMEREFDAYKLSRCMCPSNYNRF